MISSSSFLIPLREKSSVHPPITSRSPQFGHLHGFFTAGGPKWRPRVNSAKSKLSLVFVRALSVARRPWSPWRANEHRLSQELSTGRRSFPLFARLDDRVTRREPVLSKKTIRNHPLPLVSAPFQLPLLSSTPLSLRTHQASLCLSPSFPFLLSYTHTHTHVQTAILRCFHSFTPLYSPLPFLYFSLSPSLFAIRSPASTSLSRPFPFVLEKERNRDAIRNPFDGTKKYEC